MPVIYCIILGKLLAELESDIRITWLSVLTFLPVSQMHDMAIWHESPRQTSESDIMERMQDQMWFYFAYDYESHVLLNTCLHDERSNTDFDQLIWEINCKKYSWTENTEKYLEIHKYNSMARKNKNITNPQNKVLCFLLNCIFSVKLPSATAILWCFAFFHFIHATTQWTGISSVLLSVSEERGQGGDIKWLA